jgi:hypothetical protein
MDVVSKMYKTEGGLGSFMSGSSARVMWLLPFTVIHLGVYERKSQKSLFFLCLIPCMCCWAPSQLYPFPTHPLVSKRVLADLKPSQK